MKKKNNQKLYVVRKYIMATTAKEALRKDRTHYPDDVWVDEEWKRNHTQNLSSAIGFNIEKQDD